MTDGAVADRPLVGIDLGGTGSRFVAVAASGEVLATRNAPTPDRPPSDPLGFFRENLALLLDGGEPASIGIGASGPVDRGGIIRNPHTLPAFSDLELTEGLAEVYGVPVFIDNDAVTAALGEHRLGAARGSRDFLMVTLGTGVGLSAFRDGLPVRGADGWHPEGGHMSIDGPEAPCYCGRRTCWEQVSSRTALQRTAASLGIPLADGLEMVRLLAESARRGDRDAAEAFASYGRRLGSALANLLTLFRCERVVLGGSVSSFFECFQDGLHERLDSVRGCYPTPKVAVATLGDAGGAIGAALLGAALLGGAR